MYAGFNGKTEETVGDYIADGINEKGEYIEVQTGSFGPLKKKIKELSEYGTIRIIHPIAVNKIIETYSPNEKNEKEKGNKYGNLLYRRKSPLKGNEWELFNALLYAPELPLEKNVIIEIVLVDITEIRVKDGKGSWRRKGISIRDKKLNAWHESFFLRKKNDYLRFVPFKKKENFTCSLFAEKAGIKKDMARKVLYVLNKMKVIDRTGKNGRSWVYIRNC